MITIRLDFETRSAADIRRRGGFLYATDPTTQVLCLAARIDGLTNRKGEPSLEPVWCIAEWRDGINLAANLGQPVPMPEEIRRAMSEGCEVSAFNVSFEQAVWRYVLGWPEPMSWSCTMALCAVNGLPQSLEKAAKYLNLGEKHADGFKLMKKTCQPMKDGHFYRPTAAEWKDLVDYCRHDVVLEAAIADRLGAFPAVERTVWEVDNAINARGVYVDRALAKAATGLTSQLGALCDKDAREATRGAVKGDDLFRVAWLLEWINGRGVKLEEMTAAAVSGCLRRKELPDDVRAVLKARQRVSKISVTKLEGMLEQTTDADPRLRGQFRYCATVTGRWKSRGDEDFFGRKGDGVQLQNLPKSPLKIEAVAQCVDATLAGNLAALTAAAAGEPEKAMVSLVRPAIAAPPGKRLLVVDYASIEARGALWLAGDRKHLKWFADYDAKLAADPYCTMASKTFGRPITKADKNERNLGKVQMLASQYGMGVDRFIDQAVNVYGVDKEFAESIGEAAIKSYREEFASLAGGWYKDPEVGWLPRGYWARLEWSAKRALEHREFVECGPVTFGPGKYGDLAMRLPSGRVVRYHQPRLETPPERPGQKWAPKPQFAYTDLRSGFTEFMYGGKWLENATQAVCRDLLAHAMVQLEAAGFHIVMTIHDEIVCEASESAAHGMLCRMEKLMCELPAWAAGMPVAVEGFTTSRYGKEAYPEPAQVTNCA